MLPPMNEDRTISEEVKNHDQDRMMFMAQLECCYNVVTQGGVQGSLLDTLEESEHLLNDACLRPSRRHK